MSEKKDILSAISDLTIFVDKQSNSPLERIIQTDNLKILVEFQRDVMLTFRNIANNLGVEWVSGELPIDKIFEKIEEFRKARGQVFLCPDCGYKVSYREFLNQEEFE